MNYREIVLKHWENERRRSEWWWSHLSGYECERVWEPQGDLPTITTALNPANERRRSEWWWSHLSGSNRRPDDYKSTALRAELRWLGALSRGRTHTPVRETDFESVASANSAIRALNKVRTNPETASLASPYCDFHLANIDSRFSPPPLAFDCTSPESMKIDRFQPRINYGNRLGLD